MPLKLSLWPTFLAALAVAAVAGCASRPINPPLATADRAVGYRWQTRAQTSASDTLIILAFSGGGTRAAAFSYGVLEELRDTEVTIGGRNTRLIDSVDLVTGVSGGSFTALAYGLYGDAIFDHYETQFLKHDVQGELIAR